MPVLTVTLCLVYKVLKYKYALIPCAKPNRSFLFCAIAWQYQLRNTERRRGTLIGTVIPVLDLVDLVVNNRWEA